MTRNEIARKVQGQSAIEIELVKGEGYWYFTASNVAMNVYESQTEYVMYLSDMDDAEWIARGKSFLAQVEANYDDRKAA